MELSIIPKKNQQQQQQPQVEAKTEAHTHLQPLDLDTITPSELELLLKSLNDFLGSLPKQQLEAVYQNLQPDQLVLEPIQEAAETEAEPEAQAAAVLPSAAARASRSSARHGKPYICKFCPERFATVPAVALHWVMIHKKDAPPGTNYTFTPLGNGSYKMEIKVQYLVDP